MVARVAVGASAVGIRPFGLGDRTLQLDPRLRRRFPSGVNRITHGLRARPHGVARPLHTLVETRPRAIDAASEFFARLIGQILDALAGATCFALNALARFLSACRREQQCGTSADAQAQQQHANAAGTTLLYHYNAVVVVLVTSSQLNLGVQSRK